MVKKTMYQKIQELKKKGKTRREIVTDLGLDKKTVKKYYNMDETAYLEYLKELLNRDKVFEKHKDEILEIYEKNDNRRLNMASVYDYLEEKYISLPGNEKTLRNYISHLIETNILILSEKKRIYTQVPELPYGKQMQLDFGEKRLENGLKLYIFACFLSSSRYKYVKFQSHPFKTIDVIHHLLDCFDFFGGMPEEMVIDQDKLMVVSENYGDVIYTKDFEYFRHEMGIDMYVCRKADPESKGKVENLVKYVKINFLDTRSFDSVEAANASLFKWLNRRGNGKISQATKRIPAEDIKEERNYLRKVKNSIFRKDSLLGREDRLVTDNYISVNACYYGLPGRYDKRTVEIYLTENKVFIFNPGTGEEITSYDLSIIPGKKYMHREFKRDTGKPLSELKKEAHEMFDFEGWEIFLQKNSRQFSRYFRDQCIEAKKYFSKGNIDKEILNKAIEFCLQNKTLSMSNLNDTYQHYLSMHNEAVEYFGMENIKNMYNAFYTYSPIDVKKRDVEEYRRIVSGGVK